MMSKKDGFSTLLVTTVLLSAMLILLLGLYKSVFFNIKQINNEISYRKSYWQAEGGLECLFAYIQYYEQTLEAASFCNKFGLVTRVDQLEESQFRLESTSGYFHLSRDIITNSSDEEGSEHSEAFSVQWQQGTWYEY